MSSVLKTLKGLDAREVDEFFYHYLPLLAKSITVHYEYSDAMNQIENFIRSPGWDADCHFKSHLWRGRVDRWVKGTVDLAFYNPKFDNFYKPVNTGKHYDCIPIFPGYALQALDNMKNSSISGSNIAAGTTQTTKEQKPMNKLKNTADTVMDTNKQAALIAAKLSVGKTSNSFVMGKLLGKFPWYTKLFAKKKDFTENPVAKLVAAETAATLVAHFAPNNEKLKYISEAMVQDAVVDITYSSDQLKSIIDELENLVQVPNFGKTTK